MLKMKVTLNVITQPVFSTKITEHPTSSMLPEEYMIYCARVSSPETRLDHKTAPKLLRYLADHGHWSPFEMISIGFEIETSRAIGTQLLRHRSFSFQEFSQRYSEVDKVEPIEIRKQAMKNRQSSTEIVDDLQVDDAISSAINESVSCYKALIDRGVAKECARMVLPLAAQTTIVMHGTLRSWIHFLDQRCSEHAQKEIRLIALEIRKQLSNVCPWTASGLGWNK